MQLKSRTEMTVSQP